MSINSSTVYWITGLSGAGKSTVSKMFQRFMLLKGKNTILLDGDELRQALGKTNNFSRDDRKKLSETYSRLANLLSNQGFDVIVATISMFHSTREWNRKNLSNYKEIFIEVPIEILIARDQKNLYSRGLTQQIDNVIGLNAEYELPKNPDIVLVNDGSRSPQEVLEELIRELERQNKIK